MTAVLARQPPVSAAPTTTAARPGESADDVAQRRIAALAELILAGDLATHVLHRWCDANGLAEGPVRAIRRAATTPPADDATTALGVAPNETVAHRHVALVRGALPLSDAHLWYVPERLPADRLAALAETDRPFGALIADLEPTRRAVSVRVGQDARAEDLAAAATVLEIKAVVATFGRPIAFVHERYLRALIDVEGGTDAVPQARRSR